MGVGEKALAKTLNNGGVGHRGDFGRVEREHHRGGRRHVPRNLPSNISPHAQYLRLPNAHNPSKRLRNGLPGDCAMTKRQIATPFYSDDSCFGHTHTRDAGAAVPKLSYPHIGPRPPRTRASSGMPLSPVPVPPLPRPPHCPMFPRRRGLYVPVGPHRR